MVVNEWDTHALEPELTHPETTSLPPSLKWNRARTFCPSPASGSETVTQY